MLTDITPTISLVYTGAGDYDFPFLVYDVDSDLNIYHTSTTGDETPLTSGDFTASTLQPDPGGTISVTTGALPSSGTLTITRLVPYTQPTDWVNNDDFSMTLLERTQDRLVMMLQQMYATLQGTIVNSSFKGTWLTETFYSYKAVVQSPTTLDWYQCTTDHTSDVFADDLSAGYWVLVLDFSSIADAMLASLEGLYPAPEVGDEGKVPVVQSDLSVLFKAALDSFTLTSCTLTSCDFSASTFDTGDITDSELAGCTLDASPSEGDDSNSLADTSYVQGEIFKVVTTGKEMKGSFEDLLYSVNSGTPNSIIDFNPGRFRDSTNSKWGVIPSLLTKDVLNPWAVGDGNGLMLNTAFASGLYFDLFGLIKDSDNSVDVGALDVGSPIETYLPTGYSSYAWMGVIKARAAAAELVLWTFDGCELFFLEASEMALFTATAVPANCDTAVDLSAGVGDITRVPKVWLTPQASSGTQIVCIGNDGYNTFRSGYAINTYLGDSDTSCWGYGHGTLSGFMPLKSTNAYWGRGAESASSNARLHMKAMGICR